MIDNGVQEGRGIRWRVDGMIEMVRLPPCKWGLPTEGIPEGSATGAVPVGLGPRHGSA
jgi:hypothetical protein